MAKADTEELDKELKKVLSKEAANEKSILQEERAISKGEEAIGQGEKAIAQGEHDLAKTERSFREEIKAATAAQLRAGTQQHASKPVSRGGGQAGSGEIIVPGRGASANISQEFSAQANTQEQEQAEIAEATSQNAQDLQSKIEKAKSQTERKIGRIESGPHGLLAIMSMQWIMLVQGAMDYVIGLAPFVGDVTSFFIFLTLWAIPCIITFDIGGFVRIVIFLLIDLVVGLVPGIGDTLDLAPEILVMLTKRGPPRVILDSYESRKHTKIQHLKNQLSKKISDIRDSSKTALQRKIGQIRGHFGGLAGDNQKIIFLFLIISIAVLGPFGLGFLSLEGGMVSLVIGGVLLLMLVVADAFHMIDNRHLFGVIMFMAINVAGLFVLQYSSAIPFLGEAAGAVFTGLFFLYATLYTLHVMDIISSATLGKIIIFNIFLLVLPFLIGFVSDPDAFQYQLDKAQVDKEIALQDANFIDRILLWVENQYGMGKGEVINNGEMENPHTFATIQIEDIDIPGGSYLEGQPAIAYVYYSGEIPQRTTLRTECRVDELVGKAEPQFFDISSFVYPQVRCTFDNLPAGFHTMTVTGSYTYKSAVDIPLRFMTLETEQRLRQQLKDTSLARTMEEYTGGKPSLITNTGPVKIAASNAKIGGVHQLRLPMIVDQTDVEKFPLFLRFQLQKNPDHLNGEVQEIHKLELNMPAGMDITCDNLNLTRMPSAGRTVATATYDDIQTDLKDIVQCQLQISNTQTFFPPNQEWSEHTIKLEVTYDYALTKLAEIEVI